MKPKTILLTGAASGIGRAVCRQLLSCGHTVCGIDVTPLPPQEHFFPFTADITDEAALQAISHTLTQKGLQLDAIVNIAGIHAMLSLVEGDTAKIKKLVDVNLSGTMLVNRIFHTHLQPKGRIVIVTSEVATMDPMPFNGLYTVTKTALESYAQALRQELNLLGQTVVTIRPGAVQTPLAQTSVTDTKVLAEQTSLFRRQAAHFSGLAAKFMGIPISPETLSALICTAITAKRPRFTYKKHRNLGLILLNLLPKRLQCAIIKLLLNRK